MSKRVKFFIFHLTVSLFITLIAFSLVFFVWYPAPLAKAVGVTHIFLMMLAIDSIIGPMLGLLVYKEDKKTLKFDLSVIILIQVAALYYGIYSIAQGRPVWLVHSVDRIELIRNNDIQKQPNVKVKAEYQYSAWTGPKYVGVLISNNNEQKQNDMFNAAFGLTLAKQPDRYVKFNAVKQNIQKYAQDLNSLDLFNNKQDINHILNKYPDADAFVPLKANAVDMVVLINKDKGEVIKIVDLRPWK
ncbi:type IV pilin accessory protein [Acinetobacter johnsonii]|uniref:TfpX/TfpZ family type IV pilin accessory protein n=1 Tax=Acinetobacter johnsonii TaxID=40214 RepID=UPI001CC9A384|nr:TfpX/TfpZ family type IV pilin accessory protein [Acinetobacter johnsonii]MDH1488109.1 type IV pilin accessory protein [Acinetobacter johnsonii]MDH1614041.1 type IV pilin accessory protein [Acinetobacter johnsonii]